VTASTDVASRVARIHDALPQTQCTRCGYPDCRGYAEAIANDQAAINRCPPGGQEGIERLARLTGQATLALDPVCGTEGPRRLALIDEHWCIGCTLCIDACPVDCIVGAAKRMHTVIDDLCTGCELCIPVCPVDCIAMVDTTSPATGWQAWSQPAAARARQRYEHRQLRLAREQQEHDQQMAQRAAHKLAELEQHSRITDPSALQRKRAGVAAALARSSAAPPPVTSNDDAEGKRDA